MKVIRFGFDRASEEFSSEVLSIDIIEELPSDFNIFENFDSAIGFCLPDDYKFNVVNFKNKIGIDIPMELAESMVREDIEKELLVNIINFPEEKEVHSGYSYGVACVTDAQFVIMEQLYKDGILHFYNAG
jgi:hypothetical protein